MKLNNIDNQYDFEQHSLEMIRSLFSISCNLENIMKEEENIIRQPEILCSNVTLLKWKYYRINIFCLMCFEVYYFSRAYILLGSSLTRSKNWRAVRDDVD